MMNALQTIRGRVLFGLPGLVVLTVLGLAPLSVAGEKAMSGSTVAGGRQKPRPPAGKELQQAMALVQEVFAGEIKEAKTSRQKSDLATRLLKEARQPENDAAARYALLRTAGNLAMKAGDVDIAFQCADLIGARYDVNISETKATVLESFAAVARPQDLRRLVPRIETSMDEAIQRNRIEVAERFVKLLQDAARKLRDPELRTQATGRARLVAEMKTLREAFEQAEQVLQKEPGNDQAEQTVGQYRCFIEGDWEVGLSQLVRGGPSPLKAAAEKDLADPKDAEKQLEAADAWWKLADTQAGSFERQFRARAVSWYLRARPAVTGISEAKARNRIEEYAKRFGKLPPAASPRTGATEEGPAAAEGELQSASPPSELEPLELESPKPEPPKSPPRVPLATVPSPVERPFFAPQPKSSPVMPGTNLAANGPAIDLLQHIDPVKQVCHGTWQKADDGLRCAAVPLCPRIMVPVIPEGGFQWEIEFTRENGNGAIALIFPIGNSFAHIEVSGFHGQSSGLAMVNGAGVNEDRNPTRKPSNVTNNVRHKIVLRVRPSDSEVEIDATYDGKEFVRWKGSQAALSGNGFWRLRNPQMLGLGADGSLTTFHRAVLRMLDGKARVVD